MPASRARAAASRSAAAEMIESIASSSVRHESERAVAEPGPSEPAAALAPGADEQADMWCCTVASYDSSFTGPPCRMPPPLQTPRWVDFQISKMSNLCFIQVDTEAEHVLCSQLPLLSIVSRARVSFRRPAGSESGRVVQLSQPARASSPDSGKPCCPH